MNRAVKLAMLTVAIAAVSMALMRIAMLFLAPAAYALPPAGSPVLAENTTLPRGYESLAFDGRGIRGSYVSRGQRISLETVRGPPTPWLERLSDGGTPLFEIDARIMAGDGTQLLTQFGGDGPKNVSWDPGESAHPDEVSDQEAHARFEAAADALDALKGVRFARPFAPEYQALANLAGTAREMTAPGPVS